MRRRRRERIFRNVCGWVSALSLFYAWGVAGSLELGEIGLLQAGVHMAVAIALFALFAWLAGAFEYQEPPRRRGGEKR